VATVLAPQPDAKLVDALAQLSFLLHDSLAGIAARHDLSIVQTRLLGVLRDHRPTMYDLGQHLRLDKSSITGLVDRAERRGLVARIPNPDDRRSWHVSITPAGRRLADTVATEYATTVRDLTARLTASERRTLTHLAAEIVAPAPDRASA
jgi:DNA-binding MarR family transcriptional regulator